MLMHNETQDITDLILQAAEKARREVATEPEPELTKPIQWPVDCTVGPGLEGAIACETNIGYVNGTKGWLIYRGYDIFDLCAHCTFEEVSYLLLYGDLPTSKQLELFKAKLTRYRYLPHTMRMLMGFPVEKMNTMAALRLGANLMRQELTFADIDDARPDTRSAIGADEDSIPQETTPMGEKRAVYEFKERDQMRPKPADTSLEDPASSDASCHLIAGIATIAAGIARLRKGGLPIEPDPELGHAGNFLYMMTGRRPTPEEERIMDVALILHADHGMNASTFASMVVASTLSDIYFAVGAGIAALNGPLHGGANEQVLQTLHEIGSAEKVKDWYANARKEKRKIMGFGHRVYKAYDPRARVLGPLAYHLAPKLKQAKKLLRTASKLEKEVVRTLGKDKGIFPNVDFYSGIVYTCMGVPREMFTPIFAVSRVSGWTARVMEYMKNNRIFRPRAMYVGPFDRKLKPIARRK
jgi:citrate synthase